MSTQEERSARIVWIGLSPAPRETPIAVEEVTAFAERGLEGDHHAERQPGSKRQVTLIQREPLSAVAAELGRELWPGLCRRNLVVEGLELLACLGGVLSIGRILIGDLVRVEMPLADR